VAKTPYKIVRSVPMMLNVTHSPSMSWTRRRGRLLPLVLAVVTFALVTAASASAAIPAGNWVWYYQRVQPSDSAKFAGARAVVVADQTDDAGAVATIHAAGALALHYVNIYWYPADGPYEGIDIAHNMDWTFCAAGSRPLLGRVQGGVKWYSVDLNERPVRAAILSYLRSLQADGYDGVFFDHGSDAFGTRRLPPSVSTCTGAPVAPHATYADAFARVMKDAAAVGLHVVVNYGQPQPLRRDVYQVVDRIMVENPPYDNAATFASSFVRDRAEEAAAHGGVPKYVQEIKTTRLGDRAAAFRRWSEAALWGIDVTVNAGDDGCIGVAAGRTCWHYGTFPELTAAQRGRALDPRPLSRDCPTRTSVQCLWVRRWQRAVVVVNATRHALATRITTGSPRCRIFSDVWAGSQLQGGACVHWVRVVVPAHSGRIYTETS